MNDLSRVSIFHFSLSSRFFLKCVSEKLKSSDSSQKYFVDGLGFFMKTIKKNKKKSASFKFFRFLCV